MNGAPSYGESFFVAAIGALRFPVRPAWLLVLVMIPLLNQCSALTSGPWSILSVVFQTVSALYTLGLVQSIVQATARGVDLVLPNFTWKTAFGGLAHTILGWLLLLAVCLGPFVFVHHHTKGDANLERLLLGAGLAYFPMGLLALLETGWPNAINPLHVASSARRAPLAYGLTVLLLLPHFYLAAGVDSDQLAASQPGGIKFALRLGLEIGALYFALYWSRVLGLFYRFHRQLLNW